MTQSETYSFLAQGAIYRRPEGTFCLFWEEFNPDEPWSFGIQTFYERKIKGYTAKRQILNASYEDLKSLLQNFVQEKPWNPWSARDFSNPDFEPFGRSFEVIQKEIAASRLEKAVPIVFSKSARTVAPLDRAHWLLKLIELPANLHLYGYWELERGVMGASPETLFHIEGGKLNTMALAGTRARKSESGSGLALLSDRKELHEHDIVVQDLESQLADYGTVSRGETHVLELSTLSHLCTLFEVQLKSVPDSQIVEKLVQKLHPTPALGLAPRSVDFSWLEQLPEQAERKFFGAPLAFRLANDEFVAVVMIRGIQWNNLGSEIGTGCGIVASSQVEKEWVELANKRNAVYQSLGFL